MVAAVPSRGPVVNRVEPDLVRGHVSRRARRRVRARARRDGDRGGASVLDGRGDPRPPRRAAPCGGGYLSARTEPAKTRPRTVYELTDKGLTAFRAWLAAPSTYPRIQHEAAIRLFASDLGDLGAALSSLHALRDELPRLEAVCDMFEERARGIPHRTKATVLELSLVRRLLQAHREWIDDVERELGDSG